MEDYVWEAIFAYTKNLPLIDPVTTIRRKLLFDVIDPTNAIGWSAKALRWAVYPRVEFELVIQRADIFKKSKALGFENLTLNSSAAQLGDALLKHWYEGKVHPDANRQGVSGKRIAILLKSRDLRTFALLEDNIAEYASEELEWRWTDETRTGLRGLRRRDGFCVFRWYPNQKQLFERFTLPEAAPIFTLEPKRLPLAKTIALLLDALNKP